MELMSEPLFRQRIQSTLVRVEKAFDGIDPDIAETEMLHGALTIIFGPKKQKCILSAQPSVRQLWLALASQGIAHHFNYDEDAQTWNDDKGKGIEAMSFLKRTFREALSLELAL